MKLRKPTYIALVTRIYDRACVKRVTVQDATPSPKHTPLAVHDLA